MSKLATCVLAIASLLSTDSFGSMITGVSNAGQAGTPGAGIGDINGNLSAPTPPPGGPLAPMGLGHNGNPLIKIGVEAYAKADGMRTLGGAFNVGLGADFAATTNVYDFEVSFLNLVGSPLGSPVQGSAIGDIVGPIDVKIPSPAPGLVFLPGAFGTSAATPFANGNFISPTFLRIGGLMGGGYAISNGGLGKLFFTVSVPAGLGAFALQFVANPEPGTMVLGGLAMSLMGAGYSVRRRRRKVNADAVA